MAEETAEARGRTIAQIVGDNILGLRSFRRLGQEDVARRMKSLSYNWTRTTVAELEAAGRGLRVDELLALALVFGVPPADLLDPTAGGLRDPVAFGGSMPAMLVSAWVRGETVIWMAEGDEPVWRIEPAPKREATHTRGAIAAMRDLWGIPVHYAPGEGEEGE